MNSEKIYDCVVVGKGAAGMFFSASASSDAKVAVIEKNRISGKKLLITGKGRCNLTNNSDLQNLIKNVRKNSGFMYSAFSALPSYAVMDFFESRGLALKTERGNRVFPESDRSSDVVSVLEKEIQKNRVETVNDRVVRIFKDNGLFVFETEKARYLSRTAVIATGGKSYPATGSTGDGYRFAKEFGHTVTEITPSLVPVEIEEDDCKKLQGLSLKNVSLKILRDGKTVYKDFGEMLFTHFGVSGPIVLSASAFIKKGDTVTVDLKPALDEKQLDKRVLSDFTKYANKNFSNALGDLLPSKMIPVIVARSGISPFKKVNSVSLEERKKLISVLKNLSFTVKGLRPVSEAIITSGGVDVKEINPKTMESKIVDGLYFIGEVLDVDAYTGGYNLQIAFSTAYLAAKNIFTD